jgi:hypothetical protein
MDTLPHPFNVRLSTLDLSTATATSVHIPGSMRVSAGSRKDLRTSSMKPALQSLFAFLSCSYPRGVIAALDVGGRIDQLVVGEMKSLRPRDNPLRRKQPQSRKNVKLLLVQLRFLCPKGVQVVNATRTVLFRDSISNVIAVSAQ